MERFKSLARASESAPSPVTDSALHYRPDIDGLRAVAVIATMWFHFAPSTLPGGFIGVDIFFVISGYLITGVIGTELSNGSFSFGRFYARRIKRILPALCLVLVTVAALGWILLLADEYTDLGKQILAAGGFSSNILLMVETGYFNPISENMPLRHLWSIGVEEQFYIAWPLILVLCWRARWRLVSITTLLGLCSLALSLWISPHDGVAAFYSPLTRLWELLAGAGLSLYHQCSRPTEKDRPSTLFGVSRILFILGCALLIAGFVFIHPFDPFPGWRALIPVIGAGLIIAARTPSRAHNYLLENPLMVGIGLISYPLYLWHWPLFSYATILSSGEPSAQVRWLVLGATITLSVATYYCCEIPIRRGRARLWKVVAPLLSLAAVSAFGGSVYLANGFPHRPAALPVSTAGLAATYAGSCAALTQDPTYPDDWCYPFLSQHPASVLLLGDSLSAPYSAMLTELARTHPFSFKQFARGQCTALLNYGPSPCRELLDKVLHQDFIKDVTTVILALDWRAYVHGKHYLAFKNAPDDTAESFAIALRTTLDYWEKLGKRVVIFYSPPQGMNVEACKPRPFSITDPTSCRYTRRQAEARDADYRLRLAEIIGQRSHLRYFDPVPSLCADTTCMVTHGAEYMYRDTVRSETDPPFIWNHLSQYGAEYLARASRNQLIKVIGPREER